MRRTNAAFIPSTFFLVIQIVLSLVLDKILLDNLSSDMGDFRAQFGSIGTFYMIVSLLVVFCCVAILFERSTIKYIFMLLATIIFTVIGIFLRNFLYVTPIFAGIIAFVSYLIADSYVSNNRKPA